MQMERADMKDDVFVEVFYNEEDDYYEVTLLGSDEYDGETFDTFADAEAFAEEVSRALRCPIKKIGV